MWGGDMPPPEENADLPGFTPERVHLLMQGVYGGFPHHNEELHLDRGNCGRLFMAATLTPAHSSVSKMVCHTL